MEHALIFKLRSGEIYSYYLFSVLSIPPHLQYPGCEIFGPQIWKDARESFQNPNLKIVAHNMYCIPMSNIYETS